MKSEEWRVKFTIDELPSVGRLVAEMLKERPVAALHGAMGAGKTTLVREVARALGVTDEVTSPTFALVNQYAMADGEPLYHFDLYRVESLAEALDMGIEEYLDSGAPCLIEWPDIIAALIPPDTIHLRIAVLDHDTRELIVK